MLTKFRTVPAVTAAGCVALAGLSLGGAPTSAAAGDVCRGSGTIPASALATGIRTTDCDLTGRVVDGGLMSAQVPPAGLTVHAEALMPAGAGEVPTLVVSNHDGVVTAGFEHADKAHAEAPDAAGSKRATGEARVGRGCSTTGSNAYGYRFKSRFNWHYQGRSTPSLYAKRTVEYHLKQAARNVATGRDACGLNGDPRLTQVYKGRTTAAPNVRVRNGSISCGRGNLKNVVGFKSLPGPLGVACTWVYSSDRNRVYGSDVAIDKTRIITLRVTRRCSNRYELQGIMTHEFTHSAGFGHTNNNTYTMDPTHQPCDVYARTYTRGEWIGMKRKYGMS